ncbi:hypothetical protein M3Y99_01830300 [Aphelenchoides fujianensis]|nr:hypothetical protein M3Y99_01830300 [Aphelenchoides fujianensis]
MADVWATRLLHGLSALFNDAARSDFVVAVGGVEFKVYKHLLEIHSEFFARMFASAAWTETTENRVEFPQFAAHPTAMEAVLRFCYSGELQPVGDERELIAVFKIAHYFELHDLLELCAKKAGDDFKVTNLFGWLPVAFEYDDEDAKAELLEFAVAHVVEFRRHPAYAAFALEHPHIIAALFERMVEEKEQK